MKIYKPFRFKKFEVAHSRSALKVGIDGTLLGAWCSVPENGEILDIGTGCGLIALMCAQRSNTSNVTGVEIDTDSAMECDENFKNSPWASRIKVVYDDFTKMESDVKYDLIVSNPPYFEQTPYQITMSRNIARHQCMLTLENLISKATTLLADRGIISIIIPYDREKEIINIALQNHLYPMRICRVKGKEDGRIKRSMIEFSRYQTVVNEEEIALETSDGTPTDKYITLCKDFYLKF